MAVLIQKDLRLEKVQFSSLLQFYFRTFEVSETARQNNNLAATEIIMNSGLG